MVCQPSTKEEAGFCLLLGFALFMPKSFSIPKPKGLLEKAASRIIAVHLDHGKQNQSQEVLL